VPSTAVTTGPKTRRRAHCGRPERPDRQRRPGHGLRGRRRLGPGL